MTPSANTNSSSRIASVDALRGFALTAIVLLHCIEHYNLFCLPEWQPQWLNAIDSALTDTIWFILAGKAYATFSLLFGFSFYIQLSNARKRGCDFRMRFAWRLLLLACFAQLHALFYNGDILLFYAFCGLILIPASSWSNRTIITVAAVLLLQPINWAHMITALFDPSYIDLNSRFARYATQAEAVGMHGTLLQTLADNIGNGQLYSNFWQIEAGRITQTPGLFLLGMWLGRRQMFVKSAESARFWRTLLIASLVAFGPVYLLKEMIAPTLTNTTWICHYGIALGLPLNAIMMAALVSAFMLAWFARDNTGYRFQRLLIPFGRMSLTNYITQSVIGVILFYNFGFGLYRYCGATLSALIGVAIVTILNILSHRRLATHRQGPLEALWKRLTWL